MSFINTLKQRIGRLTDHVVVPYVDGVNTALAFLHTNYYHTHGKPFCYPDHADDVVLTAGAGAWDVSAALVEVVPKGVLNYAVFDIHWLNIADISENAQIQVDLFAGDVGEEVRISPSKTHRNAVQSQEGSKRIQIPQQPSGTRISARLSSSTANATTCAVSVEGHYYRM